MTFSVSEGPNIFTCLNLQIVPKEEHLEYVLYSSLALALGYIPVPASIILSRPLSL